MVFGIWSLRILVPTSIHYNGMTLSTTLLLAHDEPQGCCPSYADEAHERAFAVYVNCDVGIQPFLLIVRTGRIVTAHAHTLVWHMRE